MRTGSEYLSTLNDDRRVYLDGERITNVADHPAFKPIAAIIAELFDLAAKPANAMIYISPEICGEANVAYSIPRSQEDLVARE